MNTIKGHRIAVDMDEVLFPMIRPLNKHYKNMYKKQPPSGLPKSYNYSSYYNISEIDAKFLVKSFYFSDTSYNTKPLPNAVHAMKNLKKHNKLTIVTGRQNYLQCKNVTQYLVYKYFEDIFDSIIYTNSYSLYGEEIPKKDVCLNNNFDILIDDSIQNCETCSAHNVKCILFGDYEWNNECNDFTRIKSWEKNSYIN